MSGQRFDARLMQPPFQSIVGTKVTAAAAAGATTLLVEMAGDFDDAPEQGVAYLRIRPTQQPDADPVAPFVVAYSTWDGELDEQEYIVLTAGLPVAVPAESLVDVWSPDATAPLDVTLGEPVTVYEALVMPDDEDVNAEPLTVTVHPDLMDTMGALDGLTEDTPVLVETQQSYDPYGEDDGDDELFLTRVLGGSLVRDGGFIDEETLPTPDLTGVVLEPTTPPASSPALTVDEGPGAAIVRFALADAVRYDLYVAAGATATTPPSTAPTSLMLHTKGVSSPIWVDTYPDGSLLPVRPSATPDGQDPEPDEYAWFALVATNGVTAGGGNLDAPASPWVQGRRGYEQPDVIARRFVGQEFEGVRFIGPEIDTTRDVDRGVKLRNDGLRAWRNTNDPVSGAQAGDRFFAVLPDEGVVIAEGESTVSKLTVKAPDPAGPNYDPLAASTSMGGRTELPVRGKAVMQSATQPPNAGPIVDAGYQTVQFTDDGLWGQRTGWTTDGTSWYTARGRIVERWSSTGTLVDIVKFVFPAISCGVVRVQNEIFAAQLAADDNTNFGIRVIPASSLGSGTEVFGTYTSYPTQAGRPTLGYDSTAGRLLLVEPSVNGSLRVRKLNPSNGSVTESLTGARVGNDLSGVAYGTDPEWSGSRYMIGRSVGGGTIARTDTGAADADVTFQTGTQGLVGFTKANGSFVSMDTGGLMRTYTGVVTDLTKYVSSTFARGGSLTVAPTKQTMQSTRTKIVMPKRSRLTITAAAVPPNDNGADDPDRVRIFVGSADSRTSMYIVHAPSTRTATTTTLSTFPTSGAVPPATANFDASTPYEWTSQAGSFKIDGNGNGNAGTGSFFTDVRDRIITAVRTSLGLTADRFRYGEANTGTFSPTTGTSKDVPITFGITYSTPPRVVPFVAINTAMHLVSVGLVPGSVTTTGATLRAGRTTGGGAFDVAWVAIPTT